MKKSIILVAALSVLSTACTSITTKQSIKNSVSETSDSIMFNFKDPIEKFTYVVFKNHDPINPQLRERIVKTCHLNKDGVSEKDFLMFAKYDPQQAQKCLDMLATYKHPSFMVDESLEQDTHREFMESVPVYKEHFFGITPEESK